MLERGASHIYMYYSVSVTNDIETDVTHRHETHICLTVCSYLSLSSPLINIITSGYLLWYLNL